MFEPNVNYFENSKYRNKFLVATPKLIDLDICSSVVYIINDGSNGKSPVGIILNGRKINEVFVLKQNVKNKKILGDSYPVHFSGTQPSGISFFYNDNVYVPDSSYAVAENVYSGTYQDFVNYASKDLLKDNSYRLFSGNLVWKNSLQLEFEIKNGAWKLIDFDKNSFFDFAKLSLISGKPETRLSPSFN